MDWDKIVDEYSDHLGKQPNTGHTVRDVAALPYPREIVRSAIKHCLIREKDPQMRELLKISYLALAYYQQISPDERRAVEVMSDMGSPNMSLEQVKELAQKLAPHLEVHSALLARVQADSGEFAADLNELDKAAPFFDFSNANVSLTGAAMAKIIEEAERDRRD
jgi:hypothetical protein